MPGYHDVTYSHRAMPFREEATFKLGADALEVSDGRRSGRFPYRDIEFIRLRYQPRNIASEGYSALIRHRAGTTARLNNLTWRSMVEMGRQDGEYRALIETLIARAANANPKLRLEAGMWSLLYPAAIAAGVAPVAISLALLMRAAAAGLWLTAAMAAAFGIFFGLFAWRYLTRNRPRYFAADAIPDAVIPAQALTTRTEQSA